MLDVGVLVIRVVVGLLMFGHGAQKLFGWFDGPGLAAHESTVRALGYRRPRLMARLHATAEVTAGLLLAAGLLTPAAVAAIIAVMLNAMVVVHWENGLWVTEGGLEYPLVLTAVAAGLGLTGPGRFALDGALAWTLTTPTWGIGALVAGLVVGLLALGVRSAPRGPRAVGDASAAREPEDTSEAEPSAA